VLVHLVEELMQGDEVRPFHVPMRLLGLRLQVDGIRQPRVAQFDHLAPRAFGQVVLRWVHRSLPWDEEWTCGRPDRCDGDGPSRSIPTYRRRSTRPSAACVLPRSARSCGGAPGRGAAFAPASARRVADGAVLRFLHCTACQVESGVYRVIDLAALAVRGPRWRCY